jgi:hypothetical protein
MILQTKVEFGNASPFISTKDRTVTLGSCFSDEIGHRLSDNGFEVLCNPFGVLYNPASIARSVELLAGDRRFTEGDIVSTQDGFSSFYHHSRFNRPTAEEFLDNANRSLEQASAFFSQARFALVTFGTAWVFRHRQRDMIVSNCHKLPAAEFERSMLSAEQCGALVEGMVSAFPDKTWIFTVSPIRHLADGAHGNRLSKATLLLAVDGVVKAHPLNCFYFPAYEIMEDELRDYRFYQENMTHPTSQAADYIFERFTDFAIDPSPGCRNRMAEALKELKRAGHRPNSGATPSL